jgi:hypothetical protein
MQLDHQILSKKGQKEAETRLAKSRTFARTLHEKSRSALSHGGTNPARFSDVFTLVFDFPASP